VQTRKGFELLARFGYAARGAVYVLVAGLALFSSFGTADTSSSGALSSLLGQPFGQLALGAIAVGLLGHVAWRLAQSLLNADGQDADLMGYGARAGQLLSAVTHGFLAFTAASLALGNGGGGSGGNSEEGLVAAVLQLPFGNILVGIVGLGVIAAGIGQFYYGFSGRFKKRLRLPADREKLLSAVSVYGLAARGVVFAIIGGFVVFAAVTVNPEQAGSLPEALDWVLGLPFGSQLYWLVAVGLLAFAGYCLILALYRHVDAPSASEVRNAVPGA
jgi:hypothetical protein